MWQPQGLPQYAFSIELWHKQHCLHTFLFTFNARNCFKYSKTLKLSVYRECFKPSKIKKMASMNALEWKSVIIIVYIEQQNSVSNYMTILNCTMCYKWFSFQSMQFHICIPSNPSIENAFRYHVVLLNIWQAFCICSRCMRRCDQKITQEKSVSHIKHATNTRSLLQARAIFFLPCSNQKITLMLCTTRCIMCKIVYE